MDAGKQKGRQLVKLTHGTSRPRSIRICNAIGRAVAPRATPIAILYYGVDVTKLRHFDDKKSADIASI